MTSRVDLSRELERLRVEMAHLRASRKRLALGNDAERRRIERDLHEGVQQHLVALAANLQLAAGLVDADPLAAKTCIEDMGRDVQLALDDARKLAHRVYPPMLEAGGLAAALRSAAVSANVPTRIEVGSHDAFPPEAARAVYFCLLEVLERAAAGTQAAVTVLDEGAALAFEVVADCAEAKPEFDQLHDHVDALGGRLTVSWAGGVTRVAGSIPLSE